MSGGTFLTFVSSCDKDICPNLPIVDIRIYGKKDSKPMMGSEFGSTNPKVLGETLSSMSRVRIRADPSKLHFLK